MPKTWASKKDAILEAKDLNSLSLEELIGSLFTHEMNIKEDEEKEGKKKRIDLDIALRGSKCIESSSSSEDDDDDYEQDEFEDVEYLIKRFGKFLSKARGAKEANKKKSKLICYECHQSGLARLDCPYLKKHNNRRKRRSLNDDSSSSSDDEVGRMCLIAHTNVVPFPWIQFFFILSFVWFFYNAYADFLESLTREIFEPTKTSCSILLVEPAKTSDVNGFLPFGSEM